MRTRNFWFVSGVIFLSELLFGFGCGTSGGIDVKKDIGPDGGIISTSDGLTLTIP